MIPNPQDPLFSQIDDLGSDELIKDFDSLLSVEVFSDDRCAHIGRIYDELMRHDTRQLVELAILATVDLESEETNEASADQMLDEFEDLLRESGKFPDQSAVESYVDELLDLYEEVFSKITQCLGQDEECAEEVKPEIQARVLNDNVLTPSSKTAVLQVVDALLPDVKGLDLSDLDAVNKAMVAEAAEREKRRDFPNRKQHALQLIDADGAFVQRHNIHPGDPAWVGLKDRVAFALSNRTEVSNDGADIVERISVGEYLKSLGLTYHDYEELKASTEAKLIEEP